MILGLGALDGLPVQAQSIPPLDEYLVRAFGPGPGGLSVSDVRDLAQTSDGYLYVAQARGLFRYNGYNFDRVALPGASSEFVNVLHVDGRDRLWLLTQGNDVGYFERGRFHLLPKPPATVTSFWETRDGTIWLGGLSGLVRVQPGAPSPFTHFTTNNGLLHDYVFGVFDVRGGDRIVVTFQGAMRMAPDSAGWGHVRFTAFGPPCEMAADVRLDGKGLWLPCRGEQGFHVLRLEPERLTRYEGTQKRLRLDDLDLMGKPRASFHHEARVWNIEFGLPGWARGNLAHLSLAHALQARDGTRWLVLHDLAAGRDELVRQAHGDLETIPLRAHFDFQIIAHLREDHEGNIWIGTDRGLFQLSRRKVFALTGRHGLSEGFTAPVLQSRDGDVWVGTWGGGLHRFAGGQLEGRFTTTQGLPDAKVRALFEDADGTLWVGTGLGFAALRASRIVLSEYIEHEVRAFAVTRAGQAGSTLWIGTIYKLLRRTRDGLREHRPGFWTDKSIWALHTDRAGALWVGSERGLFRLQGDSLRAFGEADGLLSNFVVAIHEEGDGTLWFSTYERGLYRYRNGRFAGITTREGLHADGVWRMLEDGLGGVWMSSDLGIFRVDHAQLHAVADAVERGRPPAAPLRPLVFTEAEGMPSRESNRASPGGWRLNDGRLLFNNLAGAVVIDPRAAAERSHRPRTVVEAVLADGLALAHGPGVPRVPAGTKQLSFDFAALSFVTPEQNRYRYRLDGYDENWVESGTQRRASYTNLRPGDYTFRVQGASATSEWSEPGAAYALALSPALWQTWWLRLTAVAACALLLAAAYRYRVNRLLEMQRMRLRIASDLHDDVGSNLSSIALLSEMLQGQSRLDELEQRQLHRINRAAEETIGALRDIIWLVDPQHNELGDLLHRMRNVAADQLNGTNHSFSAGVPMHKRPLGMAFMRNALLIYKEALHNVARHARASHVSIEVGDGEGLFRLRIQDDGIGFDESRIRPGRGLESIRRRAQHMGGTLQITSAPGSGTCVTFSARIA